MDQAAHLVVDGDDLVDAGTALVAGAVAGQAPHGAPLAGNGVFSAAAGAELAHQPLRHDADEAGRQQEGLDAHVDESGDGRHRIVGVQRGQHQVAGERRLHGDLGGLHVADLADHHHVRVLTQDGAQRLGKRHVDAGVHLRLPHPIQVVLDGVFHRQDVGGLGVQARERRIQRGGLARAGGARHQHDAVRLRDEMVEAAQQVRAHAQPGQVQPPCFLVEQTQHGALAMAGGQRGDPHVHGTAADAQRDAAILRQALLGNVEAGHDLDPRDQRRVQFAAGPHHVTQRAVHPEAHHRIGLEGLDVDVGCVVAGSLGEQRVDHPDDRRIVLGLQQVFHLGQILH